MSTQLKKWKSPYKNDFYAHFLFKYFMEGKLNKVLSEIKYNQQTIVDVGCGFGYLLVRLLDKSKKVIGIDQNTNLQEASNKPFANPNAWNRSYKNLFEVTEDLIKTEKPESLASLQLVECMAWDTGLPSLSVDVICSLDVLEHILAEKRKEAISEFSRILKDKGQFIYSVPNTVGPLYKIRCIAARVLGMEEDPDTEDHKNYHWKNELKNLENKFNIKKIYGYPFKLTQISPSIIIVCEKRN